ncbi:hypothetical protein [Comamonas testosteroni]|nr:hypothetical protein [Comamonas testosteroni]
MNALKEAFSGPVVFALLAAVICYLLVKLRDLTKADKNSADKTAKKKK